MFIKYLMKSFLPFYMSILLFLMLSIKWDDAANPLVHPRTLKPGTLIVATYFPNPPSELKILAEVPNDPQPLGFGFNSNNKELVNVANKVQAEMQADRTYNKIYQRWFGS
jgi:hypothetical protein